MDVVSYALSKRYTNEQIGKVVDKIIGESTFDTSIFSLPDNVVNGQVSATVKGITRTNLSKKVNGYVHNLTAPLATLEIVELQAGKTYTISTLIDAKLSADSARIRIQDSVPNYWGGNSVSAASIDYSTVTFTPTVTQSYSVIAQRLSTNDTNAIIFSKILIEETSERKSFITGTKSTLSYRLRGTNKNLINSKDLAKKVVNAINSSANAYVSDIEGRNSLVLTGHASVEFKFVPLNLKPNTRYTFSCFGKCNVAGQSGGLLTFRYSDGTTTMISTSSTSWTKITVTSEAGKTVTGIYTLRNYSTSINYYDLDTMQLDEGTIATEYIAPVTNNEVYISTPDGQPLRRVGNAYDEVSVVTGVKTQRNKEYVLQANDLEGITLGTNVDRVYTRAFNDNSKWDTLIDTNIMIPNMRQVDGTPVVFDDISQIGTYHTANSQRISFIVEKGTTLAQAKEQLTGTTVIYQLAQPIITPIDVEGTIQSFGKGTTFYIEPYYRKQHTYETANGGLVFTNKITAIDKIKKIVNGKLTEITFTATIAADGLSATVAELAGGDEVIVYASLDPAESTVPTTVIKYPMNLGAQVQGNTESVVRHDKQLVELGNFTALAYAETQLELAKLNVRVSALEGGA